MIHKFVRNFALAIGVLLGASAAQGAITEPGLVSISTDDSEPKFLNPNGSTLRLVDADAEKFSEETNKIEFGFVGEVDGKRIVSLFVSGAPNALLNIQSGKLQFSEVSPDWYSAHWLVQETDKGTRLINRWKPAFAIGRSDDGIVTTLSSVSDATLWKISSGRAKPDMANAAKSNLVSNDFSKKYLAVVEKLGGGESVQAAQLRPIHSGSNEKTTKDNVGLDVPATQTAENTKSVEPGAIVAAKVGVEEQEKRQVTEKLTPESQKKAETLFDKIHGETTGNNNFTDSVGPFQTYLKLYAHNLLGLNETVWVLADAFALGKELKAFRTGFDLPVTEEKDWYVRYAGHFSWLNPTPVDRDFQSLAINEQEHIGEVYRVTQTDGHRNETGIFFNYLNSNQAKLELNATRPRDLSFSSRDIGAFTFGSLWRETKATKDKGSYRLSISKGLNVFGATREFAVRTEARNSPLVVKGQLDARRYWKESRWHVAGAASFQWADRATEWHKHFGLGGANYAPGFPAAEVAGEIGAGVYFEVGRAFDYQPAVNGLPETVTLTPYVRGDAAYVNSLFDNLTEPLEYARDGFFLSAKLGMRIEADKWNFDVGYAVPLSGDSRFEDAREGRLSFTASLRW